MTAHLLLTTAHINDGGYARSVAVSSDGTVFLASSKGMFAYTYSGNTINLITTEDEISADFVLHQNYPNPFNPSTKIKFAIPQDVKYGASTTKLIVYDILGREIKTLLNKVMQPGTYEIEFDGSDLPSGIYFYKLSSGNFTETKKMILMK
ncbi:MAG: T9SS type A sorting domain-containing protein [Ignavibacteria bacterium]|jgi:hypothetical protein